MPVERDGRIVFGVNDERIGGRGRAQRSEGGIGKKRRAETAALKAPIDSQTADSDRRDGWTARQFSGQLGREVRCRNAGRSQRVVGGYHAAGGLDGYKAVGDISADVLGDLLMEIAVEGFLAARECGAVMRFGERFQAERSAHEPNSLRCRLAMRFSAALGAGGLRMALAKSFWSSTERRRIPDS